MKIPACIVACLLSITAFAQTKLIAFRSHSGSNANFRTAVENDLFDIPHSNFGIIATLKIDSVVRLSNERIVVLNKSYYPGHKGGEYFFKDTLTRAKAADIFAATNTQSMKVALQKKYHRAEVNNICFIGFDKKFKATKTNSKQ